MPWEEVKSARPPVSMPCHAHLPAGLDTASRRAVLPGWEFSFLNWRAFVCGGGGWEDPGISQACQKPGAHKYKPKNRYFLPAGINCPHGFSCDQKGQRDKLLSQIPLTAGSREVLVSSLAPFTVLCPPCHQRGWGSPPARLGLFSSP